MRTPHKKGFHEPGDRFQRFVREAAWRWSKSCLPTHPFLDTPWSWHAGVPHETSLCLFSGRQGLHHTRPVLPNSATCARGPLG